MIGGPVITIVTDSIKKRLKDANITEAAIIDDTFDGPSVDALQSEIHTFSAELEDDDILKEAQTICPNLTEAADFDGDSVKALWDARDRWGEKLKPHADLLFNNYRQRLAPLDQLGLSLENLGLKLHKIGAHALPPDTVSLVLLDYCLQPATEISLIENTGQLNNVTELRSEKIAKALAQRGSKCPYLVLISDRAELSDVHEYFRSRTQYLGGTFAFFQKSRASDPEAFYFRLGCWGIGHPALAPIRLFFDSVVNSLEATATDLRKTLLALDIQDYSFLQRLSLSADGEPLGEYMLDLIGAALSHRLRSKKEVCEAKSMLDEQHFTVHLPSISQPSKELQRLYQAATTEPNVGDLAPHPLHKLQTPQPPAPIPRLVLGDILAKDKDNPVFMVVNAGCDLQFSPVNQDRHPDPKLSIYLMPGKLEPLTQSSSNPAIKRTELFELDGSPYRILWDHKHVFTVPLEELQQWAAGRGCKRMARLGLVYALAMQQFWTSDVGRIGLMVTPPLTESADFQIYLLNAEGKLEPFESRVRGQVILGNYRREGKTVEGFLLTREGMLRLHAALKTVPDRFKERELTIVEPKKAEKIADCQKLRTQAEESARNWEAWFELLEREQELSRETRPRKCSNPNKMPIAFCWQTYPSGKNINEFGGKNVFAVVDILRTDAPDTPAATSPVNLTVDSGVQPS